ncbi:uncharacterized protein B0P05DRAFT_556633 [Gilbertella persicaria]|uniref:Thioredoxin domain-containing protein n=1 Tax=Rhizopus stolonifer TaxID=4846 RepID=A0A367J3G7_RHIST|nr:uncharacterized protein B0P05DRAFT_556633 [Gilbertella persicaria]KAI8062349.1 hypothetical protein B0P05DRAFT_556633 [Gilbertella persicaria]RCH84465.1 hypothetical protein CU098_009123 [Rhizopus stolonifer]
MKVVRANIENFDQEVNKAVESGNPVYVVFFGNETPETSESWCPDCVVADPLIRKAVLSVENSILIEAPVGFYDQWKGKTDHPYRVRFKLTAIPTLFKWTAAGPGEALVEDDCADADKLAKFVGK